MNQTSPYLVRTSLTSDLFCTDLSFVISVGFAWKLAVLVAISALPLWIVKFIRSRIAPAASSKLL